MIQRYTNLQIHDNSNIEKIRCFNIPGGSFIKTAHLNQLITCSIRKKKPNSPIKKKVVKAVVVATKKPKKRLGGEFVKFPYNKALIKAEDSPFYATVVDLPIDVLVRKKMGPAISSIYVNYA